MKYQENNLLLLFSESKWNKIKPQEVLYNFNFKRRLKHARLCFSKKSVDACSYTKHFWVHTQLPCHLTLHRRSLFE